MDPADRTWAHRCQLADTEDGLTRQQIRDKARQSRRPCSPRGRPALGTQVIAGAMRALEYKRNLPSIGEEILPKVISDLP